MGGSGELAEGSRREACAAVEQERGRCAALLILRALSPGSALGSSHAGIAPAGREMDRSPDPAEKESEREGCEQVTDYLTRFHCQPLPPWRVKLS